MFLTWCVCVCAQLPPFTSVEVDIPIAPQIQQGTVTVTLTALTQVGREDVTRTMLVEVSCVPRSHCPSHPDPCDTGRHTACNTPVTPPSLLEAAAVSAG